MKKCEVIAVLSPHFFLLQPWQNSFLEQIPTDDAVVRMVMLVEFLAMMHHILALLQ